MISRMNAKGELCGLGLSRGLALGLNLGVTRSLSLVFVLPRSCNDIKHDLVVRSLIAIVVTIVNAISRAIFYLSLDGDSFITAISIVYIIIVVDQ